MPKSQESINPQIAFEDVLRLAEVHGLKAPYEMRPQLQKQSPTEFPFIRESFTER